MTRVRTCAPLQLAQSRERVGYTGMTRRRTQEDKGTEDAFEPVPGVRCERLKHASDAPALGPGNRAHWGRLRAVRPQAMFNDFRLERTAQATISAVLQCAQLDLLMRTI